ncbi:HAMP domain-containing histidine kinase [Aerococcaceae bacterium DSM 111021]|nr:HAMP domain-containing histidine kinase [Aerococcaceae bacterium DSM 111021]
MTIFKETIKQPLSLKWKWGILLFTFFAPVIIISLTWYHQDVNNNLSDQVYGTYQNKYESIDDYLQQFSFPFLVYNQSDTAARPLLDEQYFVQRDVVDTLQYFEDENTTIRLFSESNQLIYETATLNLPSINHSDQLKEVQHNNETILMGYNSVVSKQTNEKIGSFQLIVKPEYYTSIIQHQNQLFWRVLLLVVLIVGVLSFILSHRFLRPLTYLNNSLDLVEEENLSDIRVRKPETDDEWSDLSLHVNKLLDKIDKYVTNQKQFVEDVSHELRTPVAIVEGHLKLLNRWGKDDPEVLEESIASSLQEITRMKGLVQEMLDLSRAENVDVDYKDEITEVYSTTEQVFNNFKIIREDFDFYLDSDDDGENLYIQAFRNHIEQILIILLDNAVKYSRERKEIHVSISKSFTKVEIAIQDFGEGMTDDDKEKVFGRFYRIDKARSRDKGGNGLGLSIAKELVEGYKGTIRVDSVINHGSIFYIEFPILNDARQIYKSKQIAERKQL